MILWSLWISFPSIASMPNFTGCYSMGISHSSPLTASHSFGKQCSSSGVAFRQHGFSQWINQKAKRGCGIYWRERNFVMPFQGINRRGRKLLLSHFWRGLRLYGPHVFISGIVWNLWQFSWICENKETGILPDLSCTGQEYIFGVVLKDSFSSLWTALLTWWMQCKACGGGNVRELPTLSSEAFG